MPTTLGSLLHEEDVQVLDRLQPPIRTLEDMMLWSVPSLVEGTNWSYGKVERMMDRVASAQAPSPTAIPGPNPGCVPRSGLGCPTLDEVLLGRHGLRAGVVTEVVGPAGVGKTQLTLSAIAAQIMQDQVKQVIFLDAESTFRPERLVEIIRDRYGQANEPRVRQAMDRVHIAAVRSPEDIAWRLGQLGRWREQGGVGLIILDSVAAIYRYLEERRPMPSVVYPGSTGTRTSTRQMEMTRAALVARQGQLGQLASLLKSTALDLCASVLVVNQVTGRGQASTILLPSGAGLKSHGSGDGPLGGVEAALGQFWSHSITNRIFLYRTGVPEDPQSQNCNSYSSTIPSGRLMRLVKCPYLATGIDVPFTIGLGGVFGVVDASRRSPIG
ncbi:MAG: P-loop containing nucleoside triphosphate hydrolase protein [Piptocephalis tieghemiana]|nr:MAG: P-loop containing nucleoside triphosphate hydrolase protein [Piptocephalis tieghemiana]